MYTWSIIKQRPSLSLSLLFSHSERTKAHLLIRLRLGFLLLLLLLLLGGGGGTTGGGGYSGAKG